MAEIIERLGQETPLNISSQSTSAGEAPTRTDDGVGSFKMSAEITFSSGVAQYSLGSGSTGFTCHGSFSAPGAPDNTILTFSEKEGTLQVAPDAKLEGTLGLFVFNMDSFMSQKGVLAFFFLTQDGEKQNIVATFSTPQNPNKTLVDMPDFQGNGWGGWSGPV